MFLNCIKSSSGYPHGLPDRVHTSKEGVLLRNVSPSLVLSDHFPGGGILELGNRSGKE